MKSNVKFVWVASSVNSVNEELKEYVKTKKSFNSCEEIKQMKESVKIYAATCLSCQNEILLLNKPFDICIINEASLISEPTTLAAMNLATKNVLVGSKD